jgi:hypothetical protein
MQRAAFSIVGRQQCGQSELSPQLRQRTLSGDQGCAGFTKFEESVSTKTDA